MAGGGAEEEAACWNEQSRETSPASLQLAFVYGTLKRGFGNHWLMEELMAGRHARFLGGACTKRRFPLVCGPFQVPFLLHSPAPSGHYVRGELYQVDDLALARLDDLEGVGKGHYERRPLDVVLLPPSSHTQSQQEEQEADLSSFYRCFDNLEADTPSSCRPFVDLLAEAYFACPSYGPRMADRAPHIPCYTEKEASTYVRRKDRPQNRTFLEHVNAWIEEKGLFYS